MNDIPNDDRLAFVAADREHCLDCFRLIRVGKPYYQGNDDTILCPMCFRSQLISEDFGTIQSTERVAVDHGGGLIRLWRDRQPL